MFVGLDRSVTAALADEFRLGDAVFGCCMSAFFAAVRGVPGVDLNPYTSSFFRFGAQFRDETSPRGVS